MTKCQTVGCTGHLGKFSSCIDESIWEGTMGYSTGFGDCDWYGYYARYDAPEDETQLLNEPGHPRMVLIPAGYYIVHTHSAGFVTVHRYDTETAREDALVPIEKDYLRWELSE